MRALLSLLYIVAGTYVGLIIVLYFYQTRMVFLAHVPGRVLEVTPEAIGLPFESVTIATEDGEKIHGWYVFARKDGTSKGVVLFFHGNAGNISHRLDSIANFTRMGVDVLIIDYRGYGQSSGKPSEQGVYADARAAWRFLTEERAIAPENIIVFGRSLGSVAAASLVERFEPAGLILESSFPSAVEMAQELYWFLPARLFVRLEFPVRDFVRKPSCPVLVIHSRDDEIVPFRMGQAVFDSVGTPDKQLLEIRGGHNTGFILSEALYLPPLEKFIKTALER